MIRGMVGIQGVSIPAALAAALPGADLLQRAGVTLNDSGGSQFVYTWLWIGCLLPAALLLPNTQELMERYQPAFRIYRSEAVDAIRLGEGFLARVRWQANLGWAPAIAIVSLLGILGLSEISEFLYFQF